jgi:hypothetical protein
MFSVHRISPPAQTGQVDLAGFEVFFPHENFPSLSDTDPKVSIVRFLRFVLAAEPNKQIVRVVCAINAQTTVAALEALLDFIRAPICQSSRSVNEVVERTVALLAYTCALHDRRAGRWEWFNAFYDKPLGCDLRWMHNPQLETKPGCDGAIRQGVVSQLEQSPAWGRFQADIDGLGDRLKPPSTELELLSEQNKLLREMLEKVERVSPPAPPAPPTASPPQPGPPDTLSARIEITAWNELEIFFISDERIQIRGGSIDATVNYAEFGYEDRRNGKPDSAWCILRELARLKGTIPAGSANGRQRTKVEKYIETIRKRLRAWFRISADPLPFVRSTGYVAGFKIECRRSFDT